MRTNRLVSIVLPVYNGERYLEEAIQSCITQDYTRWELIVIDDFSTDRTPEIVRKYVSQDRRIHSIRHDRNRKLPAALNTGFKNASGDYYTWISDDNYYDPSAIGKMVEFLQQQPEVDIVYCDYTMVDQNGNSIEKMVVEDAEMLLYRSCIGACFMYKSQVHHQLNGFDEDLFLVEDYDFWLRAFKSFKFRALHKNLYYYRRHPQSLTDQYCQSKELFFLLIRKVMARYEAENYPLDIVHIKERPVFIWGTGNGGRYTYQSLSKAGLIVNGFLDSDSTRWGQFYLGLKIYAPIELKNYSNKHPFIFIGSSFIKEIEQKLIELGFTRGNDFCVNIFNE